MPGPGKSKGLFTLTVRGSSTSEPMNWIGDDSELEPFYGSIGSDSDDSKNSDFTAVADRRPEPQPLGDGVLGWYGNWYTTVRVECGPGSSKAAPPLLHVTARADYEDVSSADRQRLARLARSAADRIGCRTRLPELPDDQLAAAPSVLRPARSADGSCRWFAQHINKQGQGKLPDRFLATSARDANPVESCLLAVSPDQVGQVAEGLPFDKRRYARSARTHAPLWLRTVSYFGSEARTVGYERLTSEDEIITTGTAGQGGGAWWASSVCDGRPALHTLSSSYLYDSMLSAQTLSSVFHAYVDDITKQRGCTQVEYPAAEDFRRS
ncbi:hypothetical protein AB0C70_22865 [Streptomyces sp. NPDC048564]|uniref:hypothetical protein n=1 Tax=Streptomyces sp. NPDC048564 TaxID=3155760 RepID=UPI00341E2625